VRAVAILIAGLIVSLILFASCAEIEFVGDGFSIRNLRVVLGDGLKVKPYPNEFYSLFSSSTLSRFFSWTSNTDTFTDDFEDGNYNGWSIVKSGGTYSPTNTISVTTSSYSVYEGSYALFIRNKILVGSGYSYGDAYSYVARKYSGVTGVTRLTFSCWVRLYISTTGISSYYIKQYVKVNRGGSTTILWGASHSHPKTEPWDDWVFLSYNFTLESTDEILEIGFYTRVYKSSPPDYYQGEGQAHIDNVEIIADKPIFSTGTVTQFQVTCDYSINGKYVRANKESPWNTCNYTISIYHNVDSTSSWVFAYSSDTYNASLPVSVAGWSSGWLGLLTGSYADGPHDYYIKVELNTYGIALNGSVVSQSAYVVLQLQLNWQNCWSNPSYSLRVVEACGLTPQLYISSEGISATLMIDVLSLAAALYSGRKKE